MSMHGHHHSRHVLDETMWPAIWTALAAIALALLTTWANLAW
jgi:hypothetical protein